MVEYGHGVGDVAGKVGGGAGGAGLGSGGDPFANISQFVNDSVNTISAQPPEVLVAAAVIIFLGLIILKRAF
jgi:hypothetical protein